MPDVLTFLLIDLGSSGDDLAGRARSGDRTHDTVVETLNAAGGAVVAPARPGGGDPEMAAGRGPQRPGVGAAFQLAGDAARAAVDLARVLAPASITSAPAVASSAEPATATATASAPVSFRMALCTGPVQAAETAGRDVALPRAAALLAQAGPQQVLVTASTAVMASPTLPRDVELVDLGTRVLGQGNPPERVYELRSARASASAAPDDATASNLDWARRAALGPVLGRDQPLAALESAWKATLGGVRRMVLLAGDGGIGKTTVAAELALRLHAEGALVLYGRWDQGSLAPYQAVREALGTYASRCPPAVLRRDLEGHSDEIARLLPDVGARVGGVRPPLLSDPDGERLRLFRAIVDWLDLLARRRPVLLVLDDLHWAGRSSLLLVDHLRRHHHDAPPGGAAPLMMLLTAREGELHAAEAPRSVEPLQRAADVERIELQGLDTTSVVRLMEDAIGRRLGPEDGDVVEWLARDTAGNPLFVQEVLRSVAGRTDGATALRDARNRLPDRLADMVDWRLAQLPTQTTDVLADAARLGPTFDLGLLAEATGTPPVTLRAPLEVALQAGLLRAHSPDDYAFAHEVVRRALYDQLDPARATALHRRIAAALTHRALDGEEVSSVEVADHHLRGADASTIRQAVRWARHAAEAARRETAFESAVHLLGRAVEAHDQFGGDDRSGDADAALACELRLELAEAHDRAGEFEARDRRHVEAAALARDLEGSELFARAALGLRGRLPAAPAPDPVARELVEEALARLPSGDSRGTALLLARLAHLCHFDASYDARRALSDEAVAMARRLEAPVVLAQVLVARCLALAGPADTPDELGSGEEVVRIGERTGDPDLVLQGLRVQVTALLALGRHQEAVAQGHMLRRLAKQVRHPDHLRIATMWEILVANLEGRFAEAEALISELDRQLLAMGHSQRTLVPFSHRIVPRWLQGRLAESRPVLEQLRAVNPGPGFRVGWAWSIWIDGATGQRERALAELLGRDPHDVVEKARRDYMWWPTMIGCTVAATTGERDMPRQQASSDVQRWMVALHEALTPYAGRNCVIGYSFFAGAVDHHLGTLAATLERHDEAVELLARGLERHRTLGARPLVALSARWLAHALRQRGRPDDSAQAAELQQESVRLADQLGLQGLPDFAD